MSFANKVGNHTTGDYDKVETKKLIDGSEEYLQVNMELNSNVGALQKA